MDKIVCDRKEHVWQTDTKTNCENYLAHTLYFKEKYSPKSAAWTGHLAIYLSNTNKGGCSVTNGIKRLFIDLLYIQFMLRLYGFAHENHNKNCTSMYFDYKSSE